MNKIHNIYITAGYPNLDSAPLLAEVLSNNNINMIELGMPFSDPLADGPTIQETSKKALENGMNLALYFEQARVIKQHNNLELLFMGYYNQILQFGLEKFYNKCLEVGIDALIIPDLPIAEYEKVHRPIIAKTSLKMVFMITPKTSIERIRKIDLLEPSFIYVVANNSITGQNISIDIDFLKTLQKLKLKSKTVLGFGIKSQKEVSIALEYTNGFIIGSAFLKSLKSEDYLDSGRQFITHLNLSK